MLTITLEDAQTRLPHLIDRAERGEEVIVAREGRPVARITGLGVRRRPIRFGVLAGQFEVPDDFDAPLFVGVPALFGVR